VALIGRSNRGLWLDVTPDGRVLAFTLGIAVLACAIFGVVPAIRGTALNPGVALKAGGRGTTESAAGFNLRSALVVIQVALSLVLTAAALLFVRTLHNLAGEALGFAPDRMLVAALDFSPARLPLGPEDLFHDRLLARIRALPGVQDAAEVSILPIDGSGWNERILVDGRLAPTLPMFNSVTPGYFSAMHTAFISGRDFRASDATAPRAAIVNQAFVTRFLAGGNALGRTFEVVKPVGTARPRYVVIGVVADAKYRNLREPFPPTAYLDMAQMPAEDLEPHLIVRTSRPFLATSEAVTRAVAEINPDITVRYRTMDGVIDEALSRERVMAILSAVFGALATVIAIIGLYGVISYAVARRRMEIGIRLALGAERGSVVRLIIYQAGVLLIVPGLAIGGFLAVLAGRAAASLLYGVYPGDPLTMTAAIGSLGAVAFVSCAIPAWRASRVSPIATLHED
jgi:predicted permease